MNVYLSTEFAVVSCCHKDCGVTWAHTRDFQAVIRNDSTRWFYCPNGHRQHYTSAASDAEKLRRAEARETALADQLSAAVREAEGSRVALLRDRQRFANGVCPCCNRSFDNVRRHMVTKHPDYDVTKVKQETPRQFKCSCGRKFETLHGLRVHQGWSRRSDWDSPSVSKWLSHLTEVTR